MHSIIDQLTSGILIVDDELNILDWNKWLAVHTSIAKKDAVGKNLKELFDYIDEGALKRKVKTTIALSTPSFYAPANEYLIKINKEKLIGQTFDHMIQHIKISPLDKSAVIIISDYTEIKEAYSRLEELNNRATHYIEIIDRYVNAVLTDEKGIIKNVSAAMCNLTGYSKEELIGKRVSVLRHPETDGSLYKNLWSSITTGTVWQGELKNLKKNKETFYVKSSIFPVDGFFKDASYQAILEDVTDKYKIEQLTIIDELTKLYNRRYFNSVFLKELNTAKRNENIFAFFMIDIDFFKQFNDEYGHQAGDETLTLVAKCLSDSLKRSGDIAFRLGGEEFGVIATLKNREDALSLAELLRQNVQNLNIKHIKNPHQFVTISIGIEAFDALKYENQEDIQNQIYAHADFALYRAKKLGRNQVNLNDSTF